MRNQEQLMKHVVLFIISVFLTASGIIVPDAGAASRRPAPDGTLKSRMEAMHEMFGVNFVYDSSIDLDVPCKESDEDAISLNNASVRPLPVPASDMSRLRNILF